jgi:hypothetical protein
MMKMGNIKYYNSLFKCGVSGLLLGLILLSFVPITSIFHHHTIDLAHKSCENISGTKHKEILCEHQNIPCGICDFKFIKEFYTLSPIIDFEDSKSITKLHTFTPVVLSHIRSKNPPRGPPCI